MSAPEWSPGVPITVENLEPVFLAAVAAGDVEGVDACLRLCIGVDPRVAARWFDELSFSVSVSLAALPAERRPA